MELNRRDFLKKFAAGSATAIAAGSLSTAAFAEEAQVGAANIEQLGEGTDPIVTEFAFPGDTAAPDQTEYEADVVVVGCGWAGLHAAVTAARAGQNVIVVDKGRPGYSGMAPFSQGCTYFDAELGDNMDANLKVLQYTGEYLCNIEGFRHTLENSKQAYEENFEFGLTGGYMYAPASGITEFSQDKEYFQANLANERHHKWMQVLSAEGVTVLPHTMAVNVLVADDGRACGIVALHVKSGTAVTVAAKAVILCAGSGSYKPGGFVVGGDTFDGACMAYDLGLTIVGMEFDDFHQTNSFAPGDYYFSNTWDYVEPYTPYDTYNTAPVSDDEVAQYAAGKHSFMSANRVKQGLYGLAANDGSGVSNRTTNGSANPDDPRCAYCLSWGDQGKNRTADSYGACPGMPLHMASGVYCGWDERNGATPITGLYVAGDGEFGDMAEGVVYGFVGSTSTNCSVQGDLAGAAAAAYADSVELAELPEDQVVAATDAIFAPRTITKGWDPNYVVDRLCAIMTPPEVQLTKNAVNLYAALTQVEYLRDKVCPKMMGYSGHDLRICIEAQHKVTSAEMKLRAALAREESRGTHYREEFPYRDDANFLCHIGLSKSDDGHMTVSRIEIPEEWKGDLTADYATRYPGRFPGEEEALGLTAEAVEATGSYAHKD
ncbi:MAG: FAD-binding protein [Coriobacteriales bacterium]|nr:FAD-binding protein [Coriobacteriales bacterium]